MSYHDVPWVFRPIDRWPTEMTRNRRHSPFRSSWPKTISLLSRELRLLKARNMVIQIAMTESDLRLDGKPRASARATHPGVIIAFDSEHGPLKYAVDTYLSWEDNVRAIALALTALRAVDRYGVTKRGEQYTGWREIPQHTGLAFSSADEAAEWMAEMAVDDQGGKLYDPLDMFMGHLDDAYRLLARRLHPDSVSGSHEEFVKLQAAHTLIKQAEEATLTTH